GIYQQMGIKLDAQLQRKVETYKDVPIDALTFILTPTDPNSPEGQVIASMYGQGMNLRIATVNNLLVYTLGADPSAAMKELIDQVRSASSTAGVPSEIQAATQLIPGSEKAQFFATYNLLRLIQMGTTIAPMPIAIPPVKSQSNIAIAGNAANGRLSVQVALPKQHLQELMGTFMQTQRQN
ncbi:MAG TPA: hypothetical protein PLT20_00135, partial [Sedimentisphaerales bacterium]|nr:hypothetical protein [Sedimentisphaerales bacterium]